MQNQRPEIDRKTILEDDIPTNIRLNIRHTQQQQQQQIQCQSHFPKRSDTERTKVIRSPSFREQYQNKKFVEAFKRSSISDDATATGDDLKHKKSPSLWGFLFSNKEGRDKFREQKEELKRLKREAKLDKKLEAERLKEEKWNTRNLQDRVSGSSVDSTEARELTLTEKYRGNYDKLMEDLDTILCELDENRNATAATPSSSSGASNPAKFTFFKRKPITVHESTGDGDSTVSFTFKSTRQLERCLALDLKTENPYDVAKKLASLSEDDVAKGRPKTTPFMVNIPGLEGNPIKKETPAIAPEAQSKLSRTLSMKPPVPVPIMASSTRKAASITSMELEDGLENIMRELKELKSIVKTRQHKNKFIRKTLKSSISDKFKKLEFDLQAIMEEDIPKQPNKVENHHHHQQQPSKPPGASTEALAVNQNKPFTISGLVPQIFITGKTFTTPAPAVKDKIDQLYESVNRNPMMHGLNQKPIYPRLFPGQATVGSSILERQKVSITFREAGGIPKMSTNIIRRDRGWSHLNLPRSRPGNGPVSIPPPFARPGPIPVAIGPPNVEETEEGKQEKEYQEIALLMQPSSSTPKTDFSRFKYNIEPAKSLTEGIPNEISDGDDDDDAFFITSLQELRREILDNRRFHNSLIKQKNIEDYQNRVPDKKDDDHEYGLLAGDSYKGGKSVC